MCTEYLPDVKSDPDEPGSVEGSGERFPPRELLQQHVCSPELQNRRGNISTARCQQQFQD